MKRIVKNNLVLIVVLGISLIVTIGLLVWTALDYIQMARYINQTAKLRAEIAQLIKKTPAPVEGNIQLIENDTTLYAAAGKKLRRHFGHPFQPALDAFFETLRLADGKAIKPKKFSEEFFEEWNRSERMAQKNIDYKQFQRRFSNWPAAMKRFREEAVKITTEPITDLNIDEIFLSSIGVPRQFDGKPENLQRFMVEYRQRLLNITRDKVLFDTPEAENFSFSISNLASTFGAGMGGEAGGLGGGEGGSPMDEFPVMARQWEILGDIVKRATASGIHSFVSFHKRPMEKVGDYEVFHYSIEVSGTLASIRTLVANLDKASAENRVYVVRAINLYLEEDGAKKLLAPDELNLTDAAGQVAPQPRNIRGRNRQLDMGGGDAAAIAAQLEAERAKQEALEKALPYHRRSKYGEVLIGNGKFFRAIIDVQYIMESGNGIQ